MNGNKYAKIKIFGSFFSKIIYAILPIIIITVIAIGILFDMIGVAVLTANEANLHAKASNRNRPGVPPACPKRIEMYQ